MSVISRWGPGVAAAEMFIVASQFVYWEREDGTQWGTYLSSKFAVMELKPWLAFKRTENFVLGSSRERGFPLQWPENPVPVAEQMLLRRIKKARKRVFTCHRLKGCCHNRRLLKMSLNGLFIASIKNPRAPWELICPPSVPGRSLWKRMELNGIASLTTKAAC